MAHPAAEQARVGEPWLPDLCRLPRIGAMLGMAELAVVVIALAPDGAHAWDAGRFLSTSGYRIGRGMGFYDRFLAQPDFLGRSCGLAFEEQVLESLPVLDHDVPPGVGDRTH